MTVCRVVVTMAHTVEIDTVYREHYPPDIFDGVRGTKAAAEAMARFDAEHGDELIETYAVDNTVVSVAVASSSGCSTTGGTE